MGNETKIIEQEFAKIPQNMGDYDELVQQGVTSFGVKERVNRYGCEFESIVENNTYAPATLVNGVVTPDTAHWRLVTGIPGNYGLDGKFAEMREEMDTEKEKTAALEEAVGTGGSVDSRIASAVATETSRAQAAEADRYTKSETYTKEEVNNLITTPSQEYVSVIATDQTTSVTDVLPATGAADTTYRVGNWDGTQYNDSVFSEYAWNGSAYIKLSTKSQVGEVYDISANHADTKYADLAAALNGGANIPQSLQKGGMSVKFVQSDNKYIQYMYIGTSTAVADFTNIANWQNNDTHGLVDYGGTVANHYVTASGGSIYILERNDCKYAYIDLNSFETKPQSLYISTTRADSSLTGIILLADSNDKLIKSFSLTDADSVLNYKVDIPENVTRVYVNCKPDVDGPVIYLFNDFKQDILKLQNDSLKKVVRLPKQSDIQINEKKYVSSSGNDVLYFNNFNNSKYAVVRVEDICYQKKIYVTTTRVDSTYKAAVIFSDDNDKVTGNAIVLNDVESISNYEVNIPDGTTKILVNCNILSTLDVYVDWDIIKELTELQKDDESDGIENVYGDTTDYAQNLSGVSAVRCYGTSSYYNLLSLGYDGTANQFKISIKTGGLTLYGVKNYASRPSSGKETISFILNDTNANGWLDFVYVEVDVDWSLYNGVYFDVDNSDSIIINTQKIADLNCIKGTIDVYGTNLYRVRNNLYGSNCLIKVHSTPRFILYQNSSLNNMVFEDVSVNASSAREEYSAAEIEEDATLVYLFRPKVSLSDLSGESSSVLYGNSDYGFVRFDNSNSCNSHITSCTFKNFDTLVIADGGTRHLDSKHHMITGCMFDNCRCGIKVEGEFSRHNGNYFFGCVIGISVAASNYNANNCNFVRCDCGMYFVSSQNAHGEVSTFEFAHNGIAGVYAKTIPNKVGFIYTNCQFAQAPIIAETAYALKLSSCRLDCYIKISTGAKNSIVGNNVANTYYLNLPVYDVPQDTLITLNRAMDSNENDNLYNN